MKTCTRLLLVAGLLGALARPGNALDFELKTLTVPDADGEKVDLYFDDHGKRVFYRPPPQWHIKHIAGRCVLHPPYPMSGEMTLETSKPVSELPPPGTSDRTAIDGYGKLALSLLSAGTANSKVIESATGLLGGRELPVTRIVISYCDPGGRKRRATFCFVLYKPGEVLLVTIKSLEEDCAPVHGSALHSLDAFTPEP